MILIKTIGGSRLYGLENQSSDWDYRGVYCHTTPDKILGLECTNESTATQDESNDIVLFEVRKFLKMLKKSNSTVLEILYAPGDKTIERCCRYYDIINNREQLFDSEQFYSVLLGYTQSEIRLANGERTGKLGGKRRNSLDQYGFSPKNFCNLFRLYFTGIHLFKTGEYIVDWKSQPEIRHFLLDVKNNPEKFKKEELNKQANDLEKNLKSIKKESTIKYSFNEELANKILTDLYKHFLY